jgi:hypothetical protein
VTVYGDNGIGLDLDSAVDAVSSADIFVLGFPFCAERLLIDLREDEHTVPLVEIVEPVAGAYERIEWLNTRRPGLPPPEGFLFFVWPHSTAFLDAAPILAAAVERIRFEQGIDVTEDIERALADLRWRERQHTDDAITGGEGFETLWSRDDEDD